LGISGWKKGFFAITEVASKPQSLYYFNGTQWLDALPPIQNPTYIKSLRQVVGRTLFFVKSNTSLENEQTLLYIFGEDIPPSDDGLCGGVPPPTIGYWRCVNGRWESIGSVDIPPNTNITINGTVIINGNLTLSGGTIIPTFGSTIVVTGCVKVSGTLLIELTPEQLAQLTDQQRQTILSSNSSCVTGSRLVIH
jgi:hypothetical protein